MIRTILTIGFLLSALFSTSYAQSVYFFKTKETLELEKWDAKEASKISVANAIADELSSREKEQKQIDDLQAEIDRKLKAEDYFAADKLNKELEALQATQAKAKEIRKNIESALAAEDFANAQTLKTQLLELLQVNSSAQSSSSTASKSATAASNVGNTQTSVVSAGSGSLQDAFTSTNQSNSTGSGLFSSSSGKTDKFGRTEAENRSLARKKLVNGGVVMGSGVLLAISGAALFSVGNGEAVTDENTAFLATGAIFVVGGSVMVIAGAAMMGTSAKYKKRANQLANGTVSISPSILNIHSYSGASVNSNAGYGLTFNYQF